MSGAILPLPQYAFMGWCLFKAQGQLYPFFTFDYRGEVAVFRLPTSFLQRTKPGLLRRKSR
jgi:hypothetical protein